MRGVLDRGAPHLCSLSRVPFSCTISFFSFRLKGAGLLHARGELDSFSASS